MAHGFTSLNRNTERGILAVVCLFALGTYLIASYSKLRFGFPLDDSWIHQTYARNLALHGEWSFIPGQPSAGSTAPLWSMLLSFGYLAGVGPYIWTYLLGWLCLTGIALAGVKGMKSFGFQSSGWAIQAGVLLALEWHLVWAGASGMETLLFALLVLIVLVRLVNEGQGQPLRLGKKERWFIIGGLLGLSVWVRPDGITLLGPAFIVLWLSEKDLKSRVPSAAYLMLGAALFILPYLLFNQILTGSWLPNTFFAKQSEYAELRQIPLWKRLGSEFSLPMVGVGLLLLPGFILWIIRSFCDRRWGVLAGALWLICYLVLYALRLPVTYQHGRYIIPMMPVFFLWGFAGLADWVNMHRSPPLYRVLSKAWLMSSALVLIIFFVLGASAYSNDVTVIESEMVDTALWIRENTHKSAIVAAHDIGAIGYFADRNLIDLAGLVSPQVIPILRDEKQLESLLNASKVDYLVTFPGWYPYLTSRAVLVHNTQSTFSPGVGGENMIVFLWPKPTQSRPLLLP